ncbi:MAG: glutaredoxin family protein [Zoogloeaceae bacterium]|nr:glutaredoxin family protein [Rhodocyclaceae bacterium]MCP5234209.1 glutaredoxin family protein [Zoogloeaceae bacterium]
MGARLTVLSRRWCHLCDELLAGLEPLARELDFAIDVIDVDERPELEEPYGELVPVVLAGDLALCHYRLDIEAIRAYRRKIG